MSKNIYNLRYLWQQEVVILEFSKRLIILSKKQESLGKKLTILYIFIISKYFIISNEYHRKLTLPPVTHTFYHISIKIRIRLYTHKIEVG